VKSARPHILVLCVLAVLFLAGAHDALRNGLIDLRQSWFPRQASGDIVVIAIDSPSIEKLGGWPWPRSLHGELLAKLDAAGVHDIAFDVDFSSPSNATADTAFATALRKAGGSVVLPIFKQRIRDEGGREKIFVNRPLFQLGDAAWLALVNVVPDSDGVVRRYPYGDVIDGAFIPSMAGVLAGSSKDDSQPFSIDFSIRQDSIPTVSYADILRGDLSVLSRLADKKVIIGGTALELGDRFTTARGTIVSGPLLQALAAESILQRRDLRRAPQWLEVSAVILLMALMALLWRRVGIVGRLSVLLWAAVMVEVVASFIQARVPIIFDSSMFLLAGVCYLVVCALDEVDFRRMIGKIADDRFQRIAMSLGDGLICTDANGIVTVWNRGATGIFGYPFEQAVGQPIERFLLSARDGFLAHHGSASAEFQPSGGHVIETEGKRQNGLTFPAEVSVSAWQGAEGVQYGLVLRDISSRKQEEEKIRYLAEIDTLTGLANRNTLNAHLSMTLQAGAEPVGLLIVGLDAFKQINDTLGHAAGDEVLIEAGWRLEGLAASSDLVARLGGDEFAVVIRGDGMVRKAEELSRRIMAAFATIFSVSGRQLPIKASVGVALYPHHGATAQDLLSNADLALYRAKAEGGGRYVLFDRRIRDELETRLALRAELKLASERHEFELFYQPKVDLRDGKIVGAEALIRWHHPQKGVQAPGYFMPVVNNSEISTEVALWVLVSACEQGRKWHQSGWPIRLGVNLSPSLVHSGDLATAVGRVLKETGFPPSLLELEVTEDIVLGDEARAQSTFQKIRNLGVRIAFDDFGTGYASLTHLKKFPMDALKIDRSFVSELRVKRDDAAIVRATIGLSKEFGLEIIAEGIEDAETAAILVEMGCHEGQGYYFGRPMPAAEFEKRFLAITSDPPSVEKAATAA
jgi:diguanylate cyclase (GGDEF)-like protein/PAS domain S-box-containing protein